MRRVIGVAAVLVATSLLAVSLLAVIPAPTYNLWKLKIIVTECGHFIAPLCFLTLLTWRRSTLTRTAAIIAAFSGLLLLTPMMSGVRVLRTLRQPRPGVMRFIASLYGSSEDSVQPRRFTISARNGEPLSFDYYAPAHPALAAIGPPALIVVIHGGSWQGGDPTQLATLNYRLAHIGYAVAAVTYGFAPRDTFPAQLEDVQDQMAFLRARASSLGFDPSRIAMLGRSAGGQLAVLAAYRDITPGIVAAISMYGPMDLAWGYAHPSNPRVHASRRILSDYLGGTPASLPKAYADASPITHVARAKPTLLIHGKHDELVFSGHSWRMAEALLRVKRPATLIELPWATHACDYIARGPCYRISRIVIEQFLDDEVPVRISPVSAAQ